MQPEFMRLAIDTALGGMKEGKGGPFGAVVVCSGEVISAAANLVTSTNDPTAHAEIVAIREACRRLGRFQLADCDLYTTCEPCPMCLGAIYWARPAHVYYGCTHDDAARAGFDDAFIYEELARPVEARRLPMVSTMREEALETFRGWDRLSNRVEY